MRRIMLASGLAALIAAPIATPAAAGCKTTGTVVGAVGGGLLGHAVAGRGSHAEGTLLGAGLGALVGRQVGKSTCKHRTRTAYVAPRSYRSSATPARYATNDYCRYETRPYYDQWGQVVYTPTRVCGR